MIEGRIEGMMIAVYYTEIPHRHMTRLVHQLRDAMPAALWVMSPASLM